MLAHHQGLFSKWLFQIEQNIHKDLKNSKLHSIKNPLIRPGLMSLSLLRCLNLLFF